MSYDIAAATGGGGDGGGEDHAVNVDRSYRPVPVAPEVRTTAKASAMRSQ